MPYSTAARAHAPPAECLTSRLRQAHTRSESVDRGCRARSGAQCGVLALRRGPNGPGLIHARSSGDCPQGSKSLDAPAGGQGGEPRKMHDRVFAAEMGQLRSASSAARALLQAAGGSTSNMACRSRQKRAAIMRVLRPTSCSRPSGGMHSRLNPPIACRAKRPVPSSGSQ